jgi:predicted DNA-binding WGR domain protein
MDGQTTRFWSVSQNSNQLVITQGVVGATQNEIAQEFESQDSARLAMLELIAEKVKAGYVEDKLSLESISLRSLRRLPVAEHTAAQPTHLIRAKTFKVIQKWGGTDEYPWLRTWKITAVWIENTFQENHQIVVKLFDRPYGVKSSSLFKLKFVSSYSNSIEAEKAFAQIKDLDDLKQHVTSSNVVLLDKANAKASESGSSSMEAFLADFFNSQSVQKVEIEGSNFEQISLDRFNELATAAHDYLKTKQRRLDNYNVILAKFTIVAIRKLADMVSNDSVEDSWERARGFDGSIDFTKVSAESALLYAFASTGNHEYGYWVYVKQIVKALEKSGKHLQVLGMFYASFDSANTNYRPGSLGDSVSEWEIFGSRRPSIATYHYMQRRARRYLDDLLEKDSESHALMMMIVLSQTSFYKYYETVEAPDKAWILAHLIYRHSWKDGNHGRKIYLLDAKALANNVHIPNHIESKLLSHQAWVTKLFESSQCCDVVSFAYQLLDRANIEVPMTMNRKRLTFLLKSPNIKLRATVQEFLEQDLNRLVELFGDSYDSYIDYCSQPNAKVAELLNILMVKNNHWLVRNVLNSLIDIDSEFQMALLEELRNSPSWTNEYLSPEVRIKLLASNFDHTIYFYGEDVTNSTDDPYVFYAWINALQTNPVEKMSTKDILSVLNIIGKQLGKHFRIARGLYWTGKASMHSAIVSISNGSVFGNLARILVAYSSQLKNPIDQRNVGAVLASLIKSEADFVWLVKWADEFVVQNILLSLPELEFSVLPWHSAIKARFRQYLDSATIIEVASEKEVNLESLIDLAVAFGAHGFFENLTSTPRNRTLVVGSLRSELIRSESEIVESLLQTCKAELTLAASKDLQILFDLTSSQSLSIQQLGLDAISELGFQEKTWIRLMESQLPLSMEFVERYISSLSGSNFDDAVILCLDSSVQSVRQIGLSLLQDQAERINIDSVYVKLAETTDPHLAALVAARALHPGIPDENAVEIFDSRLLKTVRQGRRAKNFVKERRINSVLSGTPVSPEFQEMVDDLARYGNVQDRDWAIEFNSFSAFVETSESALKLMEGDA